MNKIIKNVSLILLGALFFITKAFAVSRIESPNISNISTNYANPKSIINNIDFSSKIMDENILLARGYNSLSEQTNIGEGNQSLDYENAYEGESCFKITDTITNNKGNHFAFPSTSGPNSIHWFNKIFKLPQDSYISMNVKLKGDSPRGHYRVCADGGWESGRFRNIPDINVIKEAPKGQKEIHVDNVLFWNIDSNNKATTNINGFSTDISADVVEYMYSVREVYPYNDGTNAGKIVLNSNLNRDMLVGEKIKYRNWSGSWGFENINGSEITNEWKTYTRNLKIPSFEYYDTLTRGNRVYASVSTDGEIYADDLIVGYANKVEIFRNDSKIYQGYDTSYKDTTAQDVSPPEDIKNIDTSIISKGDNKSLIKIHFQKPNDIGTDYTYTAKAVFEDNISESSAPYKINVKSGIEGYSYVIDNNLSTIPDKIVDTRDNNIELEVSDKNQPYYLHILVLDKSGNVSNVVHKKIESHKLTLDLTKDDNSLLLNWNELNTNGSIYFKVFKKIDSSDYRELNLSNELSYLDSNVGDISAPKPPTLESMEYDKENNLINIKLKEIEDIGSTYSYYIEAYLEGDIKIATSNVVETEFISRLKGVSYKISESENVDIDDNIEDIINNTISLPVNNRSFINIKSIDNNNNCSKTVVIKGFDDINPVIDLRLNEYRLTNQDITITATGNDNLGVKYLILPNGNKVYGKTANYTICENGNYEFLVCDVADNITIKSIEITNIDKTPPVLNLELDKNESATNQNRILKITAEDSLSGLAKVKLPDGSFTTSNVTSYSITKDGEYEVIAYDNLNNYVSKTISINNIDKDKPTINVDKDNNWTNKGVQININTRD